MRACFPPPARSPRPPRASHRYTCLPAATREPGGQARALLTPVSGLPLCPEPPAGSSRQRLLGRWAPPSSPPRLQHLVPGRHCRPPAPLGGARAGWCRGDPGLCETGGQRSGLFSSWGHRALCTARCYRQLGWGGSWPQHGSGPRRLPFVEVELDPTGKVSGAPHCTSGGGLGSCCHLERVIGTRRLPECCFD